MKPVHTRRQFVQRLTASGWGIGAWGATTKGATTIGTATIGATSLAMLLPAPAQAQAPQSSAWPAKAISLIAPYPAGGGIDTVARMLAERLSARLGQAVTVDNRPGAGATIGAAALARSAPDGYTLLLGSMVDYAVAPHVHKSLGFDVQRDLLPVVDMGYGTVGLIVNADVPAKTLKELIALAKAKPGELSFASSGLGGLQHLNAEMFKQMAGVNIVHVPYRGTAQFLPDLLSGRIPMTIDSIPAHLANIRAGKTRALAVASATRSATLPEVPTFAEAGLAGYETATNYTVFAPAKTPSNVVDLLNREVNAILKRDDVLDKLSALGVTVRGGSAELAQQRMNSEFDKWTDVIRKGNLTLS
jgi:tripartite-type tricarboxylate transporter receptor subunit TctC